MARRLTEKTVLLSSRRAYNSLHERRAVTRGNAPYFAQSFWPHPSPHVVMAWTVAVTNALSAFMCFCIRNKNVG